LGIGHIDSKMRASMSIMPHHSRSVSVGHTDREMHASVSVIDRKASATMSIIEQQPHLSLICARQYQSSGINQKCTFVFLANILATFFPGELVYNPK
jgi:hypothetical protein